MTYLMAVDPQKSVDSNMDTSKNALYAAAGIPAIISTGITFLYFILKFCRYLLHAVSHQTEGRVATATPGCGQQEHSTDMGKESHAEICEQVSEHFTKQYGRGTQRSPRAIPLPRRRQNICLPCSGNVAG